MNKLYFEDGDQASNITELISLFIDDFYLKFKPTFYDHEYCFEECECARRSFEDLLTVSRTYFTETTEEELMQALIDNNIRYYYCHDINKTVFHKLGSNYVKNGFDKFNILISNTSPYTKDMFVNIWEKIMSNKAINEYIENKPIDSLGG